MAAGCLYTRIRDVWKTINRGDIEQHLIKEGLPFTKDAVDAAHARYVKEIQEADEAKAREEAAQAAKKAAGTTSSSDVKTDTKSDTTSGTTSKSGTTFNSNEKPLDEETQRLLELAPRITEVVTDMWNASSLHQGWKIVIAATEKKYGVRLASLAREVYTALQGIKRQ